MDRNELLAQAAYGIVFQGRTLINPRDPRGTHLGTGFIQDWGYQFAFPISQCACTTHAQHMHIVLTILATLVTWL